VGGGKGGEGGRGGRSREEGTGGEESRGGRGGVGERGGEGERERGGGRGTERRGEGNRGENRGGREEGSPGEGVCVINTGRSRWAQTPSCVSADGVTNGEATRDTLSSESDDLAGPIEEVFDGVLPLTTEKARGFERGEPFGPVRHSEGESTSARRHCVHKNIEVVRTKVGRERMREDRVVSVKFEGVIRTRGETSFPKFVEKVSVQFLRVPCFNEPVVGTFTSHLPFPFREVTSEEGGINRELTEDITDQIRSSRFRVEGHPEGVSRFRDSRGDNEAVPFIERDGGSKGRRANRPEVTERWPRANLVTEGYEVTIRVRGTLTPVTEDQTSDYFLNHPLGTRLGKCCEGEGEKLDEIREFGDDKNVNSDDPVVVRESLDADIEESGSLDQPIKGFLVNVFSSDHPTKQNPQIDSVGDLFGEGPRARGKMKSKVGRSSANRKGFVPVQAKPGGQRKTVDNAHSRPEVPKTGGT
jgi:hypothetical protein